ncbi:hypothetical protein HU200_055443 [Digitaria exilis]|uniref:Transcription factor n=1 Tax=Digitaria exilis TaxID=1010633 RepID=A0A835ADF9_9POAL|nr:hypothetical protein HU200_055443 [Digitaria exilis]CAB3472264.1 unnamed protein product [Digitaria exilis]
MDQLVWPASFCGPPSPASFSSAVVGNHHHHDAALESSQSFHVPEQWLVGGAVVLNKHDDAEPSKDAGAANLSPSAQPLAQTRKRGRKKQHGPHASIPPAISHVEAEQQRRDRLNRRFCDLRAAVPRVTRMDRASLLSDAAAYIAELRRRVAQLEEEAMAAASRTRCRPSPGHEEEDGIALEARMIGPEAAALRLVTTAAAAARHAPARLMEALRALDLPVQHACVCRAGGGGVTVQDVVVDVPAPGTMREEGRLRAAVLHALLLQESG